MEHTGTQTSAFHGDVACQCDSCRKGRKARIRLRDAAPALLEACEQAVEAATVDINTLTNPAKFQARIIRYLKAAIRKATE